MRYHLRRHKFDKTWTEYCYEVVGITRESPAHPDVEFHVCVVHSVEAGRAVVDAMNSLYRQGVIDGMTRFAWWEDGEQFVGTTGTTLKRAIEDFDAGR